MEAQEGCSELKPAYIWSPSAASVGASCFSALYLSSISPSLSFVPLSTSESVFEVFEALKLDKGTKDNDGEMDDKYNAEKQDAPTDAADGDHMYAGFNSEQPVEDHPVFSVLEFVVESVRRGRTCLNLDTK